MLLRSFRAFIKDYTGLTVGGKLMTGQCKYNFQRIVCTLSFLLYRSYFISAKLKIKNVDFLRMNEKLLCGSADMKLNISKESIKK